MYDDFSERFREKYSKEAKELIKLGELNGEKRGEIIGEKRGQKIGEEIGRNSERVVIAKSLLEKGIPIEVVEQTTRLDRKTIQSLM